MTEEEKRKFHEERVAAGKLIDAKTADLHWHWGLILDPYGVWNDPDYDRGCIGRLYFLRAPNSDIWVCDEDLPKETYDEMCRLSESGYYEKRSATRARAASDEVWRPFESG
jgi:hypothetical protein